MSMWHNFASRSVDNIAYNAAVVQTISFDWDILFAGRTYLEASEMFGRLRELPNILLIVREKSAADARYTLFVSGFTQEQAENGELKAWVSEQMAEAHEATA